jgi:HK97 gp10 family phage protein
MAINAKVQKEINDAIAALKAISEAAGKSSTRALRKAAEPLIDQIQLNAPQSKRVHYRYNTTKLISSIKAPKGMGNKVATYYPGNLENSFQILRFRRSKAIFVGPKIDKGNTGGVFNGTTRVDGYYAHWMEYGAPNAGIPARPFIRPAVQATTPEVGRIAVAELEKAISRETKKWAKRYAQTRGRE